IGLALFVEPAGVLSDELLGLYAIAIAAQLLADQFFGLLGGEVFDDGRQRLVGVVEELVEGVFAGSAVGVELLEDVGRGTGDGLVLARGGIFRHHLRPARIVLRQPKRVLGHRRFFISLGLGGGFLLLAAPLLELVGVADVL